MAHTDDRQADLADSDFYETMPLTTNMPVQENYVEESDRQRHEIEAAARRTAIITLIMVGIVILALGFLAVRGLEAIRDSTAPATTSSSL